MKKPTVMKALPMALAMYSRLPMPYLDWNEEALSYVFCFFPCAGVICGLLLALWMGLAQVFQLNGLLFAAGSVLLPLAVTGGIHLDGFCDTCDALGSHQSRERKLEILKDSHVGAFALIGCVCYLLLFTALWSQVTVTWRSGMVLALIPTLSRTLSGLCAVTMQNARGSGLLATFTDVAAPAVCRVTLAAWLMVTGAVMVAASWKLGMVALLGSGMTLLYYRHMAKKEFGGITGDLEGWFLQVCELGSLLAVVLVQQLEVVL